jgi:hypothetical protein
LHSESELFPNYWQVFVSRWRWRYWSFLMDGRGFYFVLCRSGKWQSLL